MVQEVELRHGKPVEICGWLKKQTSLISVKKRRFFRLSEQSISCAHDEELDPTWEMSIVKARVYGKPAQQKLILAVGERTLYLIAATKAEYDAWFAALQKAAVQIVEEFYELGQLVGEGAFAKVFLGIDKVSLGKYAIKVIQKNQTDPQEIEFINRELNIMKRVNHPNVVRTFDVFDNKDKLCIVMEYMPGGTLADVFKEKREFPLQEIREIARDTISGIAYLHDNNIVHRDLKPRNILCTKTQSPYDLKLADFGLSNFTGTRTFSRAALQSQVGSPHYVAPEVLRDDTTYGPPVDMWSIGVILWVLTFKEFPLSGETMQDTLELVARGKVPFNGLEFRGQPYDLQSLFRSLLRENPRDRFTASQALSHPFFSEA